MESELKTKLHPYQNLLDEIEREKISLKFFDQNSQIEEKEPDNIPITKSAPDIQTVADIELSTRKRIKNGSLNDLVKQKIISLAKQAKSFQYSEDKKVNIFQKPWEEMVTKRQKSMKMLHLCKEKQLKNEKKKLKEGTCQHVYCFEYAETENVFLKCKLCSGLIKLNQEEWLDFLKAQNGNNSDLPFEQIISKNKGL